MSNYERIKQAVSEAKSKALEPIPAIKHIREQTGMGLGAAKVVCAVVLQKESQIGRNYNYPYVQEVLEYILRDINDKTPAPQQENPLPDRGIHEALEKVTPLLDPELQAIQKVLDALACLPTPQRQRVLVYVSSRVT